MTVTGRTDTPQQGGDPANPRRQDSDQQGAGRTGTLRTVGLVAGRELDTHVRKRSFLIGTLVMVLIIAAYPALMFFIGRSMGTTTVGFTGQATAVLQPVETTAESMGDPIETRETPDPATGRQQVREGELDALVTGTPGALKLVVEQQPDEELRSALNAVVQQRALNAELSRAGLDPAEVNERVASARVAVTSLEAADPQQGQRLALAMAAAFLLYFMLIGSGQMVAQGVVEEKSSRVVEILLSTIRPSQLLAGKVVGIGLTSLLQFVIIGAVGMVVTTAAGLMTLPSTALAGTLVWALVWFLLGFFFYATIMAAGASLVSRQEELQSVMTPAIMLLIVPFVVGVSILPSNPESSLGATLSLIPGFSPVLMPMRIALGVAAPWEIATALALTVLATVGLLWLGGRIYSNAVLRTGARVKLSEALRAA
ncbi:ABC-2 type transport system permease protein [Halopolyspora algeriensis]|uniref:ABC-2 type transport system permease protein n=1 Tax=Halopolyspora algeriensis TaxID=1500506 RepID=A0A368VQ17_9ACTN|nr:ABC transporter permease [Halopolyspora algeriensis]RCW43640.1 ABC-2 type transport system permease protein [Halopolyspora algeriensis]TQM47577.1 ABC-2 type transport system permease protein [Halopolyspora algeriensis]